MVASRVDAGRRTEDDGANACQIVGERTPVLPVKRCGVKEDDGQASLF